MMNKRKSNSHSKISLKSKIETSSSVLPSYLTSNQLIKNKYYYPALLEDQKNQAFFITKFIAGYQSYDRLQLAELLFMYSTNNYLLQYHLNPLNKLSNHIAQNYLQLQSQYISPIIHFHSFSYKLLRQNHRKKKQYLEKDFGNPKWIKTETGCKKSVLILKTSKKSVSKEKATLSQTNQLSRLSKELKSVLKKHEKKSLEDFLQEMQKKTPIGDKSAGMLKLIQDLEKDISSIQYDQKEGFSKQSTYGLSDMKKKSRNAESKIDKTKKDKRLSTNFQICHLNFNRKHPDKLAKSSKDSRTSASVRHKKGQQTFNTPEHSQKGKSNSTSKKKNLKLASDKKHKLTDTEKLYYDEPHKEEKIQTKQSLWKQSRKTDIEGGNKPKKKIVKKLA